MQEYEELASKIHEYQLREQGLQERMSVDDTSISPAVSPRDALHDALLSTAQSPGRDHSVWRGQGSPRPARASSGYVKAYLPMCQVTSVSTGFVAVVLSWLH